MSIDTLTLCSFFFELCVDLVTGLTHVSDSLCSVQSREWTQYETYPMPWQGVILSRHATA